MAFFALTSFAHAQTVAPVATGTTTPKTSASTTDEIVEMSVFTVQASDDSGYQATNTTSGSRLKTSLKDTAAAISPFTAEFLSDMGVTSLEEMLTYASNVETDTEDGTNGFNNSSGRFAGTTNARFRIRGITAGASRDYVDSAIPADFYNTERVEVASGPNSILFGMADAGGSVAFSTKRARTTRNSTSITNVYGSWDFERLMLDQNWVLIPRKLAFRLMGLYQNSSTWREWQFADQKRFTPAVMIKPFRNTVVHLNYEAGVFDNSTNVTWNAIDQITGWLAAGRPTTNGVTGGVIPDGMGQYSTTANRYTVFEDDNGIVFNERSALRSARVAGSDALVPPSIMPYDVNLVGPGGQRNQKFESWSAIVEQRAGPVSLEFGYFHNRNDVVANSSNPDGQTALYADPNETVTIGSSTMPNPRVGQFYMESPWIRDTVTNTNDVVRLTAAWELKLGKYWGRHRLAGLVEHSENELVRDYRIQIFANDNNEAISNKATPENTVNLVNHRHYFAEGDYKNYYSGNAQIDVPGFSIGDNYYHTTYVTREKAYTHTKKSINSYMLALQSYWLDNRLVTLFGYRIDDITFRNEDQARITSAADPRVLSGRKVLNEWAPLGTYVVNKYQPGTFTAGGVYHISRRISLFANASSNKSAPRFDRTVLPDGDVPPPTGGRSRDFGVMLDFFGDDRYFVRASHYDTRQFGDAAIVPNGTASNTSTILGGQNLIDIYSELLAAGKITQSQYDHDLVFYNAGMVDVHTKGYEVEFVANPTRNISIRANYSYSDRNRTNIFQEIYAYWDAKTPEWITLAQGDQTLIDSINAKVDNTYTRLQNQIYSQSGPLGSRPHKFTATGRYQFSKGILKGFTIGGGVRYQSAPYVRKLGATAAENEITTGEDLCFFDAFLTYRCRVKWMKSNLMLQLNVRNIGNNDTVTVARYTTDDVSDRVYLNEPRNIRLTATLNF
ncbi:hypothetical protein AW736_05155 [Termitidicoccus mucosus]|uniref:TonB-dependent receptor plug domain-containing protein n=1 Tax=Termitidicoccus mucosus TaxID=1184151 RepID=A0A178IMB3_9BACT|nr:hypothetical protein AW736_05155 [Opitutaceae bacterium TSB47]